ncbi:DUF3883 domain-containing protein [Clostridioides sp. ES-S-0049-03]|uniref:DUF3883 domain-containing protein n=1 Tax=Clostridioides sp. ES-S-0049-03 TaxID=2770779 RepID=UPI001D1204FA|nr:DUF3883 domain-containing protein [Clostridioides sp. ES-S-0049-03]
MLKDTLIEINKSFIEECKNSPKLTEDLAMMEKYMAESYGKRILVELLQNADDAKSTFVKLIEDKNNLYFANNGNKFSDKDVISISRSGSSSKSKGESIGYRGVGFKSTTYISHDIIIFSDNTYFSFSKKICAEALEMEFDKVPIIRIPFYMKDSSIDRDIKNVVSELKKDGFTTIFIFKKAKLDIIKEEIDILNEGYFIFLSNISQAEFKVKSQSKSFFIIRDYKNSYKKISIKYNNNIIKWLILSENNVDLGFKLNKNKIVPCKQDESVFHCYLPTMDKIGYPLKINSKFDTDPSRKHLTLNEESIKLMKISALNIFKLVKKVFMSEQESKHLGGIVELLLTQISFDKSSMVFSAELKNNFIKNKWILLENKEVISPRKYKLKPDWMEKSEFNLLRNASKNISNQVVPGFVDENILKYEDFIKKYSDSKIDIKDILIELSNIYVVRNMDKILLSKLFGNIFYNMYQERFNNNIYEEIYNCYLPIEESLIRIKELCYENEEMDKYFCKEIFTYITTDILEWIDLKYNLNLKKIITSNYNEEEATNLKPKKETDKLLGNVLNNISISLSSIKWRSAEQICLMLEEQSGYISKDVSKQNLGYDIESKTLDGNKRYLEVKSINNKHEFTITNNEYTAAHLHNKDYYLCLINHSDDKLIVTYIQDPLNNIKFEKRIKQWEWFCDDFDGKNVIINL